MVAMLFVLFDIEVVFMFPWAVTFKDLVLHNTTAFWSMAGFAFVLLVAYLYAHPKNGRPCAVIYTGTSAKALAHEQYATEERRAERIKNICAAYVAHAKRKADERAERSKPHKFQVGHILVSSWGYEQTNVDWYEVTKIVSPHMVELTPIKSTRSEMGPGYSDMSDHVIPCPGEYCGAAFRKRANSSNGIGLTSYCSASLWDGKPRYRSWYG